MRAASVLILFLLPALAQAPGPVALVEKLSGSWTLNGQAVLEGRPVSPNQTLQSSGATGSLNLFYFDGTRQTCTPGAKQACSVHTLNPPKQSTLERIVALIRDTYLHPARTAVLGVRSAAWPDAVFSVNGGKLTAPNTFTGTAARSFDLRRVSADGAVSSSSSGHLSVTPPRDLQLDRDIAPALYRANLLDAAGEPTGDYFLLLASPTNLATQHQTEYRDLLAFTQTLPSSDADVKIRLLRAFLITRGNATK